MKLVEIASQLNFPEGTVCRSEGNKSSNKPIDKKNKCSYNHYMT